MDDKIDLPAILDYERDERENTNKDLKKTAKNIDSIFLNSFSEINEKNMNSFLWQNFSIYTRKPGVDLSPFIILSLAIFTVYGMFVINSLNGQAKTFLDQLMTNNSVSLELTLMLVSGFILVIIDRLIYKNNPKEWREKFEGKKLNRKP